MLDLDWNTNVEAGNKSSFWVLGLRMPISQIRCLFGKSV